MGVSFECPGSGLTPVSAAAWLILAALPRGVLSRVAAEQLTFPQGYNSFGPKCATQNKMVFKKNQISVRVKQREGNDLEVAARCL